MAMERCKFGFMGSFPLAPGWDPVGLHRNPLRVLQVGTVVVENRPRVDSPDQPPAEVRRVASFPLMYECIYHTYVCMMYAVLLEVRTPGNIYYVRDVFASNALLWFWISGAFFSLEK